MTEGHDSSIAEVPSANLTGRPGWSWAWLVPLIALSLSAWIGWRAHLERGPLIVVHAREGHGIGLGDPIRYRGIDVGEIVAAELEDDLTGVVLRARLSRQASALASAGTRFWIVRPHLSLDEVTGLETVFGARYLEAIPGPDATEVQTEFLALEEPPIHRDDGAASLEIVLIASRRFGLQPGAPITYRQVQIGQVLSVGLASDASNIEVRALVRSRYTRLIREDSRFWEQSGLELEVGLFGGLEVGLESLRALIVGAIAVATPENPGAPALNGKRFALEEEPEEAWLAWRPSIPIGHSLLPANAPSPHPAHAKLSWTEEQLFIKRKQRRSGWVLAVDGGLLGPADLLAPAELGVEERLELQVAGARVPLGELRWQESGLALLSIDDSIATPWPADWTRTPEQPEDLLLIGDSAKPPLALSTSRYREEGGAWVLESGMGMEPSWHGACAFSRDDGRLVGILLVEEKQARIVPIPGL